MKYLIAVLLLFTLLSCNKDDKNEEGKGSDFSIIVNEDIASFNPETREIVFESGELLQQLLSSQETIQNSVGLFSTVTFSIHKSPVFESIPIQLEISSFIHNDLVLVIDQTKFFLLDGYPSLELMGDDKSTYEQERNKNFRNRSVEWDNFIEFLNEEGKIILDKPLFEINE